MIWLPRVRPRSVLTAGILAVLVASGVAPAAAPASQADTAATAPDPLRVTALTTEHLKNPLGIETRSPRFGWLIHADGRGIRQAAYELIVSSGPAQAAGVHGDVWRSGKVASARSYEVRYAGASLDPHTRYYWRVRVWDNTGRHSGWSPTAWFETAFFDATAWTADWIGKEAGTKTGGDYDTPEPLLRKEFTLNKPVGRARAYISGLGYYKLFINGRRIGDHKLDPGFTDYDKTVLYTTYDVTGALQRGANAVGVSLGRGFYSGPGPAGGCPRWCDPPKLKVRIDVRLADATIRRVVSDGSWKAADGPTLSNAVYAETYDARLARSGWTQPGFNDADWADARIVPPPKGKLRAQINEPVKIMDTFAPVSVTEPQPGVRLYDFGTVYAGWSRIVMRGEPGTTVSVRYAEKLTDDGTAGNEGRQTDTYILRGGGPEVYEPSYGYRGYRYVQVTGDPSLPDVLSVQGREVRSAVSSAGSFHSSNALFNLAHTAMRRTILDNLHSIPTDTPTYEKKGWTGDAHLFGESAIRNFGMHAFFDKWMRDFNDAQLASGKIPVVVPASPDHERVYDDPVWTSAAVLFHAYLYDNYGDVTTLRRDYSTLKRWVDHYESQIERTGYLWHGFTFGDWLFPQRQSPPAIPPSPVLIGTAYLYETTRQLTRIARTIGEFSDADHFNRLAERIATAFNDRFYDPVTKTYGDVAGAYSQTSNLLALSFGLAPPVDRAAVVATVAADISNRNNHLSTGAVGTKLILPVLTDAGYGDLAYRVATNPTYPGWGHWFHNCAATTMWEAWECDARSHAHGFFGTIDDWLFTRVAGIRPLSSAYRHIQVKPYPVGDLTRASASQRTPLGHVSVRWQQSDDLFRLDVEVPVGATADVFIPALRRSHVTESGHDAARAPEVTFRGMQDGRAVFRVGSGSYSFSTKRR